MSRSKPLVSHIYTADPRAHVFEGRVYIYPSHDVESGVPENNNGDHFDMRDYHVLSMASIPGEVTDHGVALDLEDVPWAGRQLWSGDAAYKDGTYYLYFPLKDRDGVFRTGVATSKRPEGPFKAEPEPMKGSYSIDCSTFQDDDGAHYMVFGGLWGGQLQRWQSGKYDPTALPEPTEARPAIGPRVARLSDDMLQYGETPREIRILDAHGEPILQTDHERRFFEAPWIHKYNGKYYLSYSTGDTHLLVYATGDNPYGPFTYQGVVLTPVLGWTTHHSILEFGGKWWLFYHDCELSGGKTHLRNVKVTELSYRPDGSIVTIDGRL
ncbi:glycoside hydrolase family 43 protein [Sorangium sp. So ce134]